MFVENTRVAESRACERARERVERAYVKQAPDGARWDVEKRDFFAELVVKDERRGPRPADALELEPGNGDGSAGGAPGVFWVVFRTCAGLK